MSDNYLEWDDWKKEWVTKAELLTSADEQIELSRHLSYRLRRLWHAVCRHSVDPPTWYLINKRRFIEEEWT